MVELRTVMNIEISSLCDNSCPYCPARQQHKYRPVGLMTMEVFHKAMRVVDYCVKKGTQTEVNIFGVGEPSLNPNFVEMVRHARQHIPPKFSVHTNTNGNRMTDELACALKDAGISHVDVTAHDAYASANAIKHLRKYGILGVLSADFILFPNNWAGQVDWFPPDYTYPCPWLTNGQVMIMWDGRMTTCCIDIQGKGVVGDVDSDLSKIDLRPFDLCEQCHQIPPGWVSVFDERTGYRARKVA